MRKPIYSAIAASAFFLATAHHALADWNSWEHYTGDSNASLQVRTNDRPGLTEVQWRLVNNTSESLYIAVRDKEYVLEGGGTGSGPDEGADVGPHDHYTLPPDRVGGYVRGIRASMHIR